jgi:hypothetical protein
MRIEICIAMAMGGAQTIAEIIYPKPVQHICKVRKLWIITDSIYSVGI